MATATYTPGELAGVKLTRLRPHKAPSQRDYTPRETDAGQVLVWSGETGERIGEIWSPGPLPNSAWVQPDDTPHGAMVLVLLKYGTEQSGYPATWQHDTIARCEHLARSKGLFAEYETRPAAWGSYARSRGASTEEHLIAWHCDRDCHEIRHETRDARADWVGGSELTRHAVIRALLDRRDQGLPLCRRCVYLTDPGI